MSTAKVAISLDPQLLERLDAYAAAAAKSRSEFVRDCVAQMLDRADEERTVREARAVYAAIEDEQDQRLRDGYFALAAEAMPDRPVKTRRLHKPTPSS